MNGRRRRWGCTGLALVALLAVPTMAQESPCGPDETAAICARRIAATEEDPFVRVLTGDFRENFVTVLRMWRRGDDFSGFRCSDYLGWAIDEFEARYSTVIAFDLANVSPELSEDDVSRLTGDEPDWFLHDPGTGRFVINLDLIRTEVVGERRWTSDQALPLLGNRFFHHLPLAVHSPGVVPLSLDRDEAAREIRVLVGDEAAIDAFLAVVTDEIHALMASDLITDCFQGRPKSITDGDFQVGTPFRSHLDALTFVASRVVVNCWLRLPSAFDLTEIIDRGRLDANVSELDERFPRASPERDALEKLMDRIDRYLGGDLHEELRLFLRRFGYYVGGDPTGL